MVRRQSGAARASIGVVATVATLVLVAGMAPSYADDTAPSDPATAAASAAPSPDATAASDDGASGTATESSEPAPDPAPSPDANDSTDQAAAGDTAADDTAADDTGSDEGGTAVDGNAPADAGTGGDSDSTLSAPTKKQVATAAKASVDAAVMSFDVLCVGGPGEIVGDFEIDGNLCPDGHTDWETPVGDVVHDGFDDPTGGYSGSSESSNPAGWKPGPTPNGKSDVGDAYAWGDADGGNVYAYFGLTNHSTNGGTGQYDVEYNHLDNTSNAQGISVPQRTPADSGQYNGDLLFQFNSTGNAVLSFGEARMYRLATDTKWDDDTCFTTGVTPAAGWCTIPIPAGTFASQKNADGTFFEGAVNLTQMFQTPSGVNCTGAFGSINLRSVTGNNLANSAMKERLEPLNAGIPSTCGSLTILKKDQAGAALPGAVFTITDDPRPSHSGTYKVFDGTAAQLADLQDAHPGDTALAGAVADGGADGTISIDPAEPGDYTVTEIRAPDGYFLPASPSQSVHVGAVGDDDAAASVTFTDVRKWQLLDVTKDGAGSYDVTYDWSIDKGVRATGSGDAYAPTAHQDLPAAGDPTSGSFDYQVTLTQGDRHVSNVQVTGKLYVDNPNTAPVTVSMADQLDGFDCTLDGGASVAVPASAVDQPYGYTCTYTGDPDTLDPSTLDTTNVGTITWSKAAYPVDADGDDVLDPGEGVGDHSATTGPTTIGYTAHETDKTVTVTDNQHTFDPAWTATWTPGALPQTRTYSRTLSAAPGQCSPDSPNTATVRDSATDAKITAATATASLCVGADLTVSKVVNTSLTREYLWDLQKYPCSKLIVLAGTCADNPVLVAAPSTGDVVADYTVEVTQTGTHDSNWVMNGEITVTNPNVWEPVTLTGLTDVYDGGGNCSISGSKTGDTLDGALDLVVPAGGKKVFVYNCTFSSANPPALDGRNTATVTWSASAAHTPTGTDDGWVDLDPANGDWDETPVNKTVHVFDSLAGGTPTELGTLTYGVDASPTYLGYQRTLHSDAGSCTPYQNEARLYSSADPVPQNYVGAPSTANVTVCTAKAMTVEKTATGSYERTYHWTIDKVVSKDPNSDSSGWTGADSWVGDLYSHTFGYLVTLHQDGWTDSNWAVDGAITLHNDNLPLIDPITSTVTDTPDVGSAGTCSVAPGGSAGAHAGDPLSGFVTDPIASQSDYVINYHCTFASAPITSGPGYAVGSNHVVATNVSNQPYSVPVHFDQVTKHDETVDVTDTQTSLSGATKVFDESEPTRSYTFGYELEHTADAARCQAFPNTAKVLGDQDEVLDQDTATATVCPVPGTWNVAKTSDVGDGGVPVDSDITYTLSATKAGGVDPTGVVVTDDLGDLAGHVTLPTEAQLQAAAPAGTSVDLTGTVITWTIDTLSGTSELSFTVHVDADAYDVHLPNLVTSTGAENCPDATAAAQVDACSTSNDTPHLQLSKSSDAPAVVSPPYLGDPGTVITYTLTAHNDSAVDATTGVGGTMPGATATDDLSDVLDNATFDAASVDPGGQASLSGSTLTWHLPDIPAGESVELHYQVTVNADQWNASLVNTVTEGPGQECLPEADVDDTGCTTTTETPDYTLLQVRKVDAETGDGLAGAGFTLFQDNAPYAAADDPEIGPEDEQVDTATSDADGVAQFGEELQRGHFLIEETTAPDGYAEVPVGGKVQAVEITDANFVSNDYMSLFEFRDPAEGQLAIVAKEQYERDPLTNAWVLSDGKVNYGDELRYVVKVAAVGPKLFHNVVVSDYLPGYNPVDTTSTMKATLVPNTAKCTGSMVCTVDFDPATGLVTWSAGTVTDASGAVEMVVRFPDLPDAPAYDADGVFHTFLWNEGYLKWQEADVNVIIPEEARQSGAKFAMVDHSLTSNDVVAEAQAFEQAPPQAPPQAAPEPPASTLPNTGGPAAWLPFVGVGLVALGGLLVAQERRRRRTA